MEAVIVINQYEINEHPLIWMETNNRTEGSLISIENKLKEIIGYRYANQHIRWSNIYGDEFTFYVCKGDDNWTITVWDYKGSTTICHIFQKIVDDVTDKLSGKNLNLIQGYTEDFSRGIVPCSNCKKKIKKEEIAGRYFAGVYCKECWENKYKAIEARENYD